MNPIISRVTLLMEDSYDYMDSPAFHKRRAEAKLFGASFHALSLPPISWYSPTLDAKSGDRDSQMDSKLERLMFLRFNFAKRQMAKMQAACVSKKISLGIAKEFLIWHDRFVFIREYITRKNLALILSMARRLNLLDIDFADVVSEGNQALMNSISKFDVERGFKFSTYACRAFIRSIIRIRLKESRYRATNTPYEPECESRNSRNEWQNHKRNELKRDLVDQLADMIKTNKVGLSAVELTVLKHRFNLDRERDSILTLEEVGTIIGLTKERVRQIQKNAIRRIRKEMLGNAA